MKVFKNKLLIIITLFIVIIALCFTLILTIYNNDSKIENNNNDYNIGSSLGKISSEVLAYRSVIHSQTDSVEKERFKDLLLQNINFSGENYNLSVLISSINDKVLSEKALEIESELRKIRMDYTNSKLELNKLISLDRRLYALLNDFFGESASAYKGFADGLYDDFYKPSLEINGKSSPKISDRLQD